jgi:hypothetical protein
VLVEKKELSVEDKWKYDRHACVDDIEFGDDQVEGIGRWV